MYIAASFQKTSSVTVHMASQIDADARFFYLDTDVLFPDVRRRTRWRTVTGSSSTATAGSPSSSRPASTETSCGPRPRRLLRHPQGRPDALCTVGGGLLGSEASGARTRRPARRLQFAWDKRFRLWKLNPLADWSEKDVWRYISENDIPYNPLHDQGYPSIGCTHCTRKPAAGEDPRAGRWAGSSKTECGLHG